MSEFCHMEQELVHPSLPEPSHPSKSVRWGRERRQGHEKAGGGKRAREGEEALDYQLREGEETLNYQLREGEEA